MTGPSERVVLRETVTQDQVDDLSAALGWRMINVLPATDEQPSQMLFATADRQGVVYLVQDSRLGLAYLTGTGSGMADELCMARQRLEHYPDTDLAALLASPASDEALIAALGVLALLGGSEPSQAELDALDRALAHPSPRVRNAALVALPYAPRPPLEPRVAALATGDPDPVVRSNAASVLASLYGSGLTGEARPAPAAPERAP
jgi:hypothetical protein